MRSEEEWTFGTTKRYSTNGIFETAMGAMTHLRYLCDFMLKNSLYHFYPTRYHHGVSGTIANLPTSPDNTVSTMVTLIEALYVHIVWTHNELFFTLNEWDGLRGRMEEHKRR